MALLVLLILSISRPRHVDDESGKIDKRETKMQKLTAVEKQQKKKNEHVELRKLVLKDGVDEQDLRRCLELLQATYWLSMNYDKAGRVGAFLSTEYVGFLAQSTTHTLIYRDFLLGQANYVDNKPEIAKQFLKTFILNQDAHNDAVKTAQLYLNAIQEDIQYANLFLSGFSDPVTNQMKMLDDLPFPDVLNFQHDKHIFEAFDCEAPENCRLIVVDLSIYPYLKHRLIQDIAPFTELSYSDRSEKDQLMYSWFVALVKSLSSKTSTNLDQILEDIRSAKLDNKQPYKLYYDIAKSLSQQMVEKQEANSAPLSFIKIHNELSFDNSYSGVPLSVYNSVLPAFFNNDLSIRYRDNLFISSWPYL